MDYISQSDQPLYPEILWNRPVSRVGAGRFLLIGGTLGRFSEIQYIYQTLTSLGAATSLVLPAGLRKILGESENFIFAPSTTGGSLGKGATGTIAHIWQDFEAYMFGEIGGNSETMVLVEKVLDTLSIPLVLYGEALDKTIKLFPHAIKNVSSLTIVANWAQIFKICGAFNVPVTTGVGVTAKAKILNDLSQALDCTYVTYGPEILVSSNRQLGLSKKSSAPPSLIAGVMASFQSQNSANPFKGLMAGAYILGQIPEGLSTPKQINFISREF